MISTRMLSSWTTPSKPISLERPDVLLQRLVPSPDSRAILLSKIQAHNTTQKRNQFIKDQRSIHSDTEEGRPLRTKPQLQIVSVQVDMCQRLVLTPPLRRTSQDGLFQRPADPWSRKRSQIEIRPTIPDLLSEAKLIQRTQPPQKLTLDQVEEAIETSWERLRIKCKVVSASSFTIQNGEIKITNLFID